MIGWSHWPLPFSSSALWPSLGQVWSRQPTYSVSYVHSISLRPLLSFLHWPFHALLWPASRIRVPPFSRDFSLWHTDQKLVSWVEQPNPDWTRPLPGTWKKRNNNTPYWPLHVSHLARCDSFISFHPDSHARGCPGIFTCRCRISPVPFPSFSAGRWKPFRLFWRRSGSDILFYLCLLFLLFYLLKIKGLFYSWNLTALSSSQCPKIHNQNLHLAS